MPRTADPHLKDKILDTAQQLYRLRGEKGLTLRVVAKAAGTTTTTVYKRFRDRDELLRALGNRERLRMFEGFDRSKSLEELCRYYLEYAKSHKHEYQLIYGPLWPRIFASAPGEPGVEWGKQQLANRFGGQPQDYDALARWVRLLLHGAASLIVNAPKGSSARDIQKQCLQACSAIIADAKQLKSAGL